MKQLVILGLLLFSVSIWSQKNVSNIKVKTLEKEETSLKNVFDGERYTLISVGGTWCKPCLMQKPFVASLGKQYPQYLKVIFLFYKDTVDKVKQEFGKKADSESYFLVSKAVVEKLSLKSYPTHILVNPDGYIIDSDVSINEVGKLIK